ncbi:MAG: hypothetical protein JWO86_8998 [Myxococcaceae bacterium]|nr:hypothetical protein [Myxococcaceae bacterium]
MTRTWVKLAVPQSEQAAPHIVQTSDGFVAVAAEQTSPGRNLIGPTYNYLYRSADGITWTKLTPPSPATPDQRFQLVGIAYGAGRYVVATNEPANEGMLMTSTDLAQWTTAALDVADSGSPVPPDVEIITRLNGRFFAMGNFAIFVSNDGVSFTTTFDPLVRTVGIAFGDGQFMIAAQDSVQASTDGLAWSDHSPSCSVGPCLTVPGNPTPFPGLFGNIAFLDRFYVDHVSSTDGVSWQPYAGPVVSYVIGGYAFNTSGDPPHETSSASVLRAWRAGESPRTLTVETQVSTGTLAGGVAPAVISNPLPGGETCSTHSCVVVGSALYLLR